MLNQVKDNRLASFLYLTKEIFYETDLYNLVKEQVSPIYMNNVIKQEEIIKFQTCCRDTIC